MSLKYRYETQCKNSDISSILLSPLEKRSTIDQMLRGGCERALSASLFNSYKKRYHSHPTIWFQVHVAIPYKGSTKPGKKISAIKYSSLQVGVYKLFDIY